jgi:hypothetical protein
VTDDDVTDDMAVVSVSRLEASFMAAPRCDKSVRTQCCPTDVNPQGFSSTASHRLMTPHPPGRFIPTALSFRMVRSGRMGLVRTGRGRHSARTSRQALVRANRRRKSWAGAHSGRKQRRTPLPGIRERGTKVAEARVFRRVS